MPYVGRTPTPSPVTIDDIPANSIDASKIVDGSIEVSDIKDNSITDAKLNSTKLDGIADSANNYSHPAAHTVSEVTGLQGLLDGKTTETYVNTQVAALVDSSPATLDTLNELAAALGNDPSFATTVTNSIGTKLPLAGGTMTGALTTTDLNITDSTPNLRFTDTDGNNLSNIQQSGTHLYIDNDDTGAIRLRTNGNTERVYIGANGNVGIGTGSPGAKLELVGDGLGNTVGDVTNLLTLKHTTSNTSRLIFTGVRTAAGGDWLSAGTRIQQKIDATNQGYIQFNGDGNDYGISFGRDNSERMRIDSAGNVGIGTSSPIAPLHVAGNVVIETGSPDLYFATSSASHANWRLAAQESTSNAFVISSGTHSAGSNAVADTYTPRFVVRDSGNMEIRAYNGSTSSPSEAADWPTPALSIRTYDNYYRNSVMSFGYAGDSVYQTGDSVWGLRLHDAGNAMNVSTSSSSTNLELKGPGNLTLGGIVTTPNQPAFFMGSNVANMSISVETKIPFNVAVTDAGNNCNTTNYRFTAPVAGRYSITLAVQLAAGGTTHDHLVGAYIRKNGVTVRDQYHGRKADSSQYIHVVNSAVVYMAANEYIEGYCRAHAALTLETLGGTYRTSLSGFLIG